MSDREIDPLDEVVAKFRRTPVPPLPAPSELRGRRPQTLSLDRFRRFLMRPEVRYGSAAALLMAAVAWLALSVPGSVAMAEVVEAAGRHKLARYQVREIYNYKGGATAEQTRTAYADLAAPRVRYEHTRRTMNGVLENQSVMVQDDQKGRFLRLISGVLVVDEAKADAQQAQAIRTIKAKGYAKKRADVFSTTRKDGRSVELDQVVGGRPLLESLSELRAHADATSTRADLEGRSVLRYRLGEPGKVTTVWVDPESKLPLRIECQVDRVAPGDDTRLTCVYTAFAWDPPGLDPEALFSTEPPPGYEVEDHTVDAPPAKDDPESQAVLKKLEDRVAMQFPNPIPLQEVLKYVEAATRSNDGVGVPFAFDAEALKRAGRSVESTVSFNSTDEPLKASLGRLLGQLGLTYEIRRGVLTITSADPGGRSAP